MNILSSITQGFCLILVLLCGKLQVVRGITDVSQSCLNLRWLMRQRCADPTMWALELNKLTRTYLGFSRATGLLLGPDARRETPEEIRMLAEVFKVEPEDLVSVPLYTRNSSIFRENINYLVESIPHGQKETVAKAIGITAPQFSRWSGGDIKPRKTNLRKLLKLHGIDPDLDLESVPLFLSMEPLSGFDQRRWVANRVQDLPAAEIAKIYPALRKLLRYDD